MDSIKETTLEINLGALGHNYHFLKSKLKPSTKFLGVVKAFAYGSESVSIAKKLEKLGTDYLAVAYAKEGVTLKKAGIQLPIMVLHPQPVNCAEIVEHGLEPCLYSPGILRVFLETVKATGQKAYPVHLKFNTGLNRLGFGKADIKEIQRYLTNGTFLRVTSLFSHLAASEDPGETAFTHGQIRAFQKRAGEMERALGYAPFRHVLNTSGIINFP
ncbi:MAG: alanine racemase [Bacteroidota bacterium]